MVPLFIHVCVGGIAHDAYNPDGVLSFVHHSGNIEEHVVCPR